MTVIEMYNSLSKQINVGNGDKQFANLTRESLGIQQRQDPLNSQLGDLILLANQQGLYDASDYLKMVIADKNA